MNISLDNFNDYVTVAENLYINDCYKAASLLSTTIFNWFLKTDDDAEDLDNLEIHKLARIYTACVWQGCKSDDDYAMLSEELKVHPLWNDKFFEWWDKNTLAWIYSQRAAAYYQLALSWAKGILRELYVDYAIDDATKAIDLMEELVEEDKDLVPLLDATKLKMVLILREKSPKHARDYTIALSQELTDEEGLEALPALYEDITEELFDAKYAWKPLISICAGDSVPEQVANDAYEELLKMAEENDDPYWWMFTHDVPLDNRRKLLIVNEFSEGGDNNFEEIPWVFTIDRLPVGIEFDEGHPVAGTVYEVDPYNPELYHPIR